MCPPYVVTIGAPGVPHTFPVQSAILPIGPNPTLTLLANASAGAASAAKGCDIRFREASFCESGYDPYNMDRHRHQDKLQMSVRQANVDLLYVPTSLLWWQAVAGTRGVTSSNALRTQPVAPMRECPGGHPRLPPRSCTNRAPYSEQGHPGDRTRRRNNSSASHSS